MFTWIITHKVGIIALQWGTFTMEKPIDLDMHIWQSIAHDGACMSITQVHNDTYSFFAMKESLAKTNFWAKRVWDICNLELCIQANNMLDGHIVSGHIDTTWVISSLQHHEDGSKKIEISYDTQRDVYVVPKWSIAINGVSLTVVDVHPWSCTIRLIPLTQQITNLWNICVWDLVNIEYDMFGKYIINYLKKVHPSI